jgi:diadenosine tetraphosphatase ApaH/serine/threonine PP2A family protein phosphatase
MLDSRVRSRAQIIINHVLNTRIAPKDPPRMPLRSAQLAEVISAATAIFRSEPALLQLAGHHCIVGDIHGNIDALIRIFERCGYPPHRSYLFLGDYIDRGRFSCEVVLLLYALKLLYPTHIRLLRGNHEFSSMAEGYGFRRECEIRLSPFVYITVLESFDELPLAAIVGATFCVHGGISPHLKTPEDIVNIAKAKRSDDIRWHIAVDLLWSDPSQTVTEFGQNPRGCGVLYGSEAVDRFVADCGNFRRIIRAHESCPAGYDWPFEQDGKVLTVFSSCDYCAMNNHAGVVLIDAETDATECLKLPPLGEADLVRRRVVFPPWLIDEGIALKPVAEEIDVETCLETVIDI